jgi:diamine N-acetyltransferase
VDQSHYHGDRLSVADIVIRPATIADAAAWSAFAQRTFVETFAKDNTPEDMDDYVRAAFSVDLQTREIAEPGALVLLALDAGELAGYAHLGQSPMPASMRDAGAIELKRFYVGSAWQGSGLATRLMGETMREARLRGARTLWLGVWEHNARAIAFYRKQGFRIVGSHPFLLGRDLQTDLEMAISLGAAAADDSLPQ